MEALAMSTIRFIIEGAQAADQAAQLKNYLQSEWNAQVETKAESNTAENAIHKGIDLDSIRVIFEAYGAFRILSNAPNEIEETKQTLQKLANWIENTLSLNGKVIWIEIGGMSYPLITEKLAEISQAIQDQSKDDI